MPGHCLFARWLLRAASWLVPAPERADWHAEWAAELWQVAASSRTTKLGTDATANRTSPLAFICGAIPDALYLRREASASSSSTEDPVSHTSSASPQTNSGPRSYLLTLASICGLIFTLALALPGSRHALLPHHSADASDLVLITSSGYSHLDQPATRFADYQAWRISTQKLYRELAFYQPQQHRLRIAPHDEASISVFRASNNLFDLLGLAPQSTAHAVNGQPQLFLSRSLFDRAKGRKFNPGFLEPGTSVELGGRRVIVAGILPDSQWQLPGHADAWLLEDKHSLAETSPLARGYVVAHVRPEAFPSEHRVMIDGDHRYPCLSLAELAHRPGSIFRFALLLALLALPATLPIPISGTAERTRRMRIRLRAWMYFAAKLALIVPLAYAASLCAAYGFLASDSTAAPCIQLAVAFLALLGLFRWSWQDQRSRCPECLGRLTHPARVGLASRSFLAWSGTELVCTSGHGLLHIPELPTSWFSRPRWLVLDSSWRTLFATPVP
ncbi:hypothetical protein [Silvibacterium sp.]|uniref:hypothetical protein n=1 Tax=Silvibacterium sp. TaxID=1964179 RepID=UPI0039E2D4E6